MRRAKRPVARIVVTAVVASTMLLLAGCVGTTDDDERPDRPVVEPAPPLPIERLAEFSAVASLNAGSNCTGTLIDTGVPTAAAYILTNGHCIGGVGRAAQSVTLDEEWFGTAEFFRAEANSDATLTVNVDHLEYSSMRDRDLGVVRLDATLGELQQQGVEALPITEAEPAEGTDVVNVGVPVQNLFDEDIFLRIGECSLSAQKTVIEFNWLWFGSWANDCPGIIQGSSGSPLIANDTIVAMINTTSAGVTAADGGACFINRPCEVTASGASMIEDTAYAVSVAGVGRCFVEGEFALTDDCPLGVSSVWADHGGGTFRGGDLPDASGRLPEIQPVGRFAGSAVTALVPLGDGTACTDPATYAGAAPIEVPAAADVASGEVEFLRQSVALGTNEGFYLYCLATPGSEADASSTLFQVDRTPPILPANATVESLGRGEGAVVWPHLDPPELSTVRFTWGPAGETDCSDPSTFQDFFTVPLNLAADDLPATYCVYGLDAAGNASPVTEIEVPAT